MALQCRERRHPVGELPQTATLKRRITPKAELSFPSRRGLIGLMARMSWVARTLAA